MATTPRPPKKPASIKAPIAPKRPDPLKATTESHAYNWRDQRRKHHK